MNLVRSDNGFGSLVASYSALRTINDEDLWSIGYFPTADDDKTQEPRPSQPELPPSEVHPGQRRASQAVLRRKKGMSSRPCALLTVDARIECYCGCGKKSSEIATLTAWLFIFFYSIPLAIGGRGRTSMTGSVLL